MEIRVLANGDVAELERFLMAHAASSMFLRSNVRAAGLDYHGNVYEAVYVAAFDGRRIVGVVAHAWNNNLILQAPVHVELLSIEAVRLSNRPVAGLLGPADQAADARTALGLASAPMTFEGIEELYSLDLRNLVVPESLTAGNHVCRHSRDAELPLLIQWRKEYAKEALRVSEGIALEEESREWIERSHRENVLWVLEDGGECVSTTCFNAMLPDSVQVGGVWTPPEFRGRGYARSAVAGSLIEARAHGVTQSILFTDTPAAHRAYVSLGYRVIGKYALLLFRAA